MIPKTVLSQEEHGEEYRERLDTVKDAQLAIDMADLRADESSKKKRGPKPKNQVLQIEANKEERPGISQELYDLKEAAQYLGRAVWGVRELIWKGWVPAVKHGRKLYVDKKDLDRYITKHKAIDTGGRPDRRKPRHQISLYIIGDREEEAKSIIGDLKDIAEKDFRSVSHQAFYFIRAGIEKWKKEHGTS